MNIARDAARYPQDDSISLLALWQILWAEWRLLLSIVAAFSLAAVILALVMTPVYRAEAVVTPVDADRREGAASALASQFGSLADLAGINLSSLSGGTNKGRNVIQSRSLLEQFIQRRNLVKTICVDYGCPGGPPTLWRAVEKFKDLYSAIEDPETGLITVQVDWLDPRVAADWANDLVKLANELVRQRDLVDSRRNIKYLNDQLSRTTVVGLQQAIYNLTEVEMKTLMLANAREEYVLAFVDRATVPEVRQRPKRKQLVILGTLLGGIVGTFVVAIRRTLRVQRQRQQALPQSPR